MPAAFQPLIILCIETLVELLALIGLYFLVKEGLK